MTECELCGGRLSELARTPTRVWLGCRKCHRTWSQEAAVRTGVTPPPATGVPNGLTRWMSMLTGAGVALGSVGELDTELEVAERLGYVSTKVTAPLRERIDRTRQTLHGLRRSLERRCGLLVGGTALAILTLSFALLF